MASGNFYNDIDPEVVSNIACEARLTLDRNSTESTIASKNIVSQLSQTVIESAHFLAASGPLLSVNSVLQDDNKSIAVECVQFLSTANANMNAAVATCKKLKELLEKNRTETLASYERDIAMLNEEKIKAITNTEELISKRMKAVKRAILLSSDLACTELLDPKKIKSEYSEPSCFSGYPKNNNSQIENNPFSIKEINSFSNKDFDSFSATSSGFHEEQSDDEDETIHTVPKGNRKIKVRKEKRNNNKKCVANIEPTSTSVQIVMEMNKRLEQKRKGLPVSMILPSMKCPETLPVVNRLSNFNNNILGNTAGINPVAVTRKLSSPNLNYSLAATFLMNNMSINKDSPLAEMIYNSCMFEFRSEYMLFQYLAEKANINNNCFVRVNEPIVFIHGRKKIDIILNRITDMLRTNDLFTDNETINNVMTIVNAFVHLCQFAGNNYYAGFMGEVKHEPV